MNTLTENEVVTLTPKLLSEIRVRRVWEPFFSIHSAINVFLSRGLVAQLPPRMPIAFRRTEDGIFLVPTVDGFITSTNRDTVIVASKPLIKQLREQFGLAVSTRYYLERVGDAFKVVRTAPVKHGGSNGQKVNG